MKKYIFLVFVVSLLLNCATTPPKAIMGYDLVPWGSSVATVRNVYNIGQEIQLMRSEVDPYSFRLTQENISESIKNRIFTFCEDKLVLVSVLYNDSSDDKFQNLLAELENKFGNSTDFKEGIVDDHRLYVKTFVFGKYSPELYVELVHAIDRQTNVVDGLAVVFVWEKGINYFGKRHK